MIFAVVVLAVIVGTTVAIFLRQRAVMREECRNRLRRLAAPMECCVPMEQKLAIGDPLDPAKVACYIKGNQIPRCPCGPEYDIVWKVGARPPSCPYHGALIGTDPMGSECSVKELPTTPRTVP
jgi:hypothetical protein